VRRKKHRESGNDDSSQNVDQIVPSHRDRRNHHGAVHDARDRKHPALATQPGCEKERNGRVKGWEGDEPLWRDIQQTPGTKREKNGHVRCVRQMADCRNKPLHDDRDDSSHKQRYDQYFRSFA